MSSFKLSPSLVPIKSYAINAAAISPVAALLLYGIGRLLRAYAFLHKFTIIKDIPFLGKMRRNGRIGGNVVICGGSVAGLFSAIVCSDHFQSVSVVEMDPWVREYGVNLPPKKESRLTSEGVPMQVNKRSRVMQYHATHIQQPIILRVLRQAFPEFDKEAAEFGVFPAPCDQRIHMKGTYFGGPDEPPESLFISRPVFETLLRRLVQKYRPNVQFISGTVTGVEKSDVDNDVVTGVNVQTLDGAEQVIEAKLVVDCTGAAQAGYQKWFKSAKTLVPHIRQQYDSRIYTTSASFHLPAHIRDKLPIPGGYGQKWLYTYVPNNEIERRSWVMGIVEHDTLQMITSGWNDKNLPHSIDELKSYLGSLIGEAPIEPWVFSLLDILSEHITELDATWTDFKVAPSYYIRYHEAPIGTYPRNFVALGDSIMKVNPAYAQGLSKTCKGAVTLGNVLQTTRISPDGTFPKNFSHKFFELHAARCKNIWQSAKDSDYTYESTIPVEGETLAQGAAMRKFLKYALILAVKDEQIRSTFWNIRMFLAPPTDVMTPLIVAKVFWKMVVG